MADTHPSLHVHTARLMITELRVAAAPPRTPEVSWTVLPRLASSRRPPVSRESEQTRCSASHHVPGSTTLRQNDPRVYLSHAIGIISIRLSPNSRDGTGNTKAWQC